MVEATPGDEMAITCREVTMRWDDETGASMVEYALLLTLIAALIVTITGTIGQLVSDFFNLGNALVP
jgi:Flp pilus assembly pilin Flp